MSFAVAAGAADDRSGSTPNPKATAIRDLETTVPSVLLIIPNTPGFNYPRTQIILLLGRPNGD